MAVYAICMLYQAAIVVMVTEPDGKDTKAFERASFLDSRHFQVAKAMCMQDCYCTSLLLTLTPCTGLMLGVHEVQVAEVLAYNCAGTSLVVVISGLF